MATRPAARLFPQPVHTPACFRTGISSEASLRGQVVDQSGAVVEKATVTLTTRCGVVATTTTAENGFYFFGALAPGQYTLHAAAPKLEQEPIQILLKPGTQTLRLELKVVAVQQQTTVQENANTSVNTESANTMRRRSC